MPVTNSDEIVERQAAPVTQYNSLLKRFAVRLCVAVTIGVLLLAAVELYSYKRYLHYGRKYVMEPAVMLELMENGSAANREYWKEYDQSNKVVYHQYVLWRRAPYEGEFISINQDGVRRTLHTQCDDQTSAIWMFGDSVMWGSGAPDAETIPSLVAQLFENAGKPVCVVNYAEKGWSNTQEMIALIELLKHARQSPTAVVFYDGGTEAFVAYQNGQADVHSNLNLFKNFLDNWGAAHEPGFSYLRQTNTYRFLDRIAVKVPAHSGHQGVAKTGLDIEALASGVVQNYIQNMGIIDLLAKQYGFRAIFAWYPNLAVGNKQLTPYERQVLEVTDEEFPDLSLMYHEVYSKTQEIKRPNFYNLADLVDNQKSSLYVGISHMRPEGNQMVADRLFDILQTQAQVPATAPASVSSVRKK